MNKKFEEHLMKFNITEDKLKMEIKLKDLEWLFENSPSNFGGATRVKKGKRQEFAEYIVNRLLDDAGSDSSDTVWGETFERIFEDILEGAEDEIINYPDEENY
ncbi:hypothetical protein ACY1J9_001419 [Clostridium botulinum]